MVDRIAQVKKKPPNAAELYLSKWSKKSDTYKTMRGALVRIADVLSDEGDFTTYPWHELRYETVRSVPARLQDEGLAPRTINKCLSALRGVLEVAWRAGTLPDEEYRRIKIEGVRGAGQSAGRALSDQEIEKFQIGLNKASKRDAALITLLFACGLRRVEVERLNVEDYDRETGLLRAKGKGNKVRIIPVAGEFQRFLNLYWNERGQDGIAFSSERGRITRRGVSFIVEKFCHDNGIAKFTPHDLRRSFATVLLKRGVPINVVQRLMGHANINTTAIYDKSGQEAEIEAVKMLNKKTEDDDGDKTDA